MLGAALLLGTTMMLIAGSVSGTPVLTKNPELRIEHRGYISDVVGTAVVSGKVTCPGSGQLAVHAHIRQATVSDDSAALTVHGDGYAVVKCASKGASARWQVNVFSPNGPFVSGNAECFASASLEGAVAGSSGYQETAYVPVRLRPNLQSKSDRQEGA